LQPASYPKVALLTNCSINDLDAHGALLRNYFHEWPKERLGHIFQERLAGSSDFCGHEYMLGAEDRHFGAIYARLKHSPLGAAARRQHLQADKPSRLKAVLRRIAYSLGRQMLESGLWEFVFAPKVSSHLAEWMESFAPEVVYVQGYSLFYVRLALQLHRRFSTRICVHILDDWPGNLYLDSPFAFLIRPVVRHYFKALARSSALRICIGPDMRDEYKARYGLEFVPLLNCDEISRYLDAPAHRTELPGVISVVYSGSIGVGRWKSLIDVCEVAETLRKSGLNIHVTAYVPDIPPDVYAELQLLKPVLTIANSLKDSEVPGTLKGADILLLVESFDERYKRAVRLSIATKAHLYMMAQKPILVYGPADVGVVRYAQRDGWACVATSKPDLEEVMRSLAVDTEEADEVVATAYEVAMKNHSATSVRGNFAQLMRGVF